MWEPAAGRTRWGGCGVAAVLRRSLWLVRLSCSGLVRFLESRRQPVRQSIATSGTLITVSVVDDAIPPPPEHDRNTFSHSPYRLQSCCSVAAIAAAMLSSLTTAYRAPLTQALNFALVLSTAFMLWKSLSVITASPSPIVVVLSGSMEPAFQRGDLLLLWNRSPRAEVGEVVVYNVPGKEVPIVHRVVRAFADDEEG